MAAVYRLKGLGWLTGCAIAAIGFYLVSSQVAAERKRLEQVDHRIAGAERDIRALETEFDVRANLAQLERWNGNTLALTVPTAQQFVRDEAALAALSPVHGAPVPGTDVPVQTAALIVPAAPVVAAPAPVQTAAVATAATRGGVVKVAAVQVAANQPARITAAAPVRAAKVAMLDGGLLSDSTIGDLLTGARTERSRLR